MKSKNIQNWTEGNWEYTSRSKKSNDIGKIKIVINLLGLNIPMKNNNELTLELSKSLDKILSRYHDKAIK